MRRLTAEEVRDSILSVSRYAEPEGRRAAASIRRSRRGARRPVRARPGVAGIAPGEAARRSIFVHVKRSLLVPILATHDAADTDLSCPVRYTTTVPTQALGLLNGSFANQQAAHLADRLRREAPGNLAAQVRRAVRLTTAREPGPEELRRDVEFIRSLRQTAGFDERAALAEYAVLGAQRQCLPLP